MEKLFYKYKSCADDYDNNNSSFYFLLDSLKNKYFYLTRPENLNDKDECKIYDNYHESYDDIKKWLLNHPYLLEKIQKHISPNKDPVYQIKKNIKNTEFRMVMEESRKNEREHFHIFSLTENSNNERMWDNYANGYNGICLGYTAHTVLQESISNFTDKNEAFFIETLDNNLPVEGAYLYQVGKTYLGLIKVQYVRKKSIHCKIFKLHEESEKFKMKESFLMKNNYDDVTKNKIDWSYEKESRIVLMDIHKPRNETIDLIAHYPDYVLKEVCFGHNIEKAKKEKIMETLKKNYTNFENIIFKQI